MTITRFRSTPYRPFGALNLLEDALKQMNSDDSMMTTGSFTPAVNVYENENKLTVKVETPGIRQEDLKIQVENQTLTVTGERKFEQEEKEENFHRIERRYGSFSRSFHLPSTVNTGAANASYDNGVLTIEFPKRQEAKAREIQIGGGSDAKKEPATIQAGEKANAVA